jgi:hypothetical protein
MEQNKEDIHYDVSSTFFSEKAFKIGKCSTIIFKTNEEVNITQI